MKLVKTIGLAILTISFSANAQSLVLAQKGTPSEYKLVVPNDAQPCIRHSAEELAAYIDKMTSVKIALVSEPVGGASIWLKRNSALPKGAFKFKTEGRDFIIEGATDREVLFGVYDFLENKCGCDWITSDQEVVPQLDMVSVEEDIDELHQPAFEMRENTHADIVAHPDFAAKLKLNGYCHGRFYKDIHGFPLQGGFDFGWLGKCHTFMRLVPPKKYFDAHPEYYAEIKGERKRLNRMNLCLTNPEVVKIVIDNVLARIEQVYPKAKIFGVSQSDCWDYCTCAKCRAVDEREGSQAGSNIEFVNQIADAVKAKYPDVLISTLAYEYTCKPPLNVRPRDNVMIVLCTDTCDFSKPMSVSKYRYGKENNFLEDLKKWCLIAKHVHIWDYSMNFRFKLHSFPNIYSMYENFKSFKQAGVTEVFEQGPAPSSHQAGVALKAYITARLLWNPNQPLKPLLDRFYKGYYGAAAPQMRRYMEALHKMSRQRDELKEGPMMMWGTLTSPALKTIFYERGAALLKEAAEAVKDDPIRLRNVRWEQNANDYTRIMRSNEFSENRLIDDVATIDVARAKEFSDAAKRILEDWQRYPSSAEVSEEKSICKWSRQKMEQMAAFDITKFKPCRSLEIAVESDFSRFLFSELFTAPGIKVDFEVHAKVELTDGATPKTEAFRIWVRNEPSSGSVISVKDLTPDVNGYGWYKLRSSVPVDPLGFFIIERGKAGKVLVDKLRVSIDK